MLWAVVASISHAALYFWEFFYHILYVDIFIDESDKYKRVTHGYESLLRNKNS